MLLKHRRLGQKCGKNYEHIGRVPFEVEDKKKVIRRRKQNGSCRRFQELVAGDRAAVPQLAHADVPDVPAYLGGHCKLKDRRRDVEGGGVLKERQDDVVVARRHLASGEVADEAAVALLGLNLGDGGKLEGVGVHSGPLASVAVTSATS